MTEGQRRTGRQAQASRVNGSKSRGPSSASGKARSAQNAKKHGLTISRLEASGAEQSEAQELLVKLSERYDAGDPEQAMLINRAISATLRMNRARVLITETIEDIAQPANSRILGRRQLVIGIVEQVRGLVQQMYGGDPPSRYLAKSIAEYGGYIPRIERPRRSDLTKLMRYAQRFRGERDRALSRLEAKLKSACAQSAGGD